MNTSNDAWNNFNVTMSIFQSLDNEDPNIVTMQVGSMPTNIDSPLQCKKIVFSLGKNFQPPLAVTFMWDGAELYFNYFKDQHNTKKTYAFNSWKRLPLEKQEFMDTAYVRVLHRLAGNGELNDNEKKLLMYAIICQIWLCLYKNRIFNESNPTIYNQSDYYSLDTFTDDISKSASHQNICSDVKQDKLHTKAEFVKAMNNFFTKKPDLDTFLHQDGEIWDALGEFNKSNKKNRCWNNCVTCLNNCWNSVKSCFGGE